MRLPRPTPRAVLISCWVALALVVTNIVSGAAVRLSDSGLGCPDWPSCFQHRLTPPLSLHPAIEFGNRLVVVGVVIAAAVCVVMVLTSAPVRRDLAWLSCGLVGGIIGEALIGAAVVYSKLNAYVVMTHFCVGILLLTDATLLVLRAGRPPSRKILKVRRSELKIARLMLGLLSVVVVAGTATTGAGPHAGGKGAKRVPIRLEDIVRVHSGIVLVLIALTLLLVYSLYRSKAPEVVQERARMLVGLMIVQGLIGYTQYFTHLPALLVGIHVFGATMVWMAMLWFYDGLYHHKPVGIAAPEEQDGGKGVVEVRSGATEGQGRERGDAPTPVGTD